MLLTSLNTIEIVYEIAAGRRLMASDTTFGFTLGDHPRELHIFGIHVQAAIGLELNPKPILILRIVTLALEHDRHRFEELVRVVGHCLLADAGTAVVAFDDDGAGRSLYLYGAVNRHQDGAMRVLTGVGRTFDRVRSGQLGLDERLPQRLRVLDIVGAAEGRGGPRDAGHQDSGDGENQEMLFLHS